MFQHDMRLCSSRVGGIAGSFQHQIQSGFFLSIIQTLTFVITTIKATTSCPSGLRSHVKAVVLIGAGSNPADVIFIFGPLARSVLEREREREREREAKCWYR